MLVLPLKATTRFDLNGTLATWLDGDEEVSFRASNPLQIVIPKPSFKSYECRDDLLRLGSLRNCLAEVLTKPNGHKAALDENALTDLYEYHAALLEFEKRGFPTMNDDSNGLTLEWKGAFSPSKESHSTLVWDRCCTMWNVVALQTCLASNEPDNRDGYKAIVQQYQVGASVLSVLSQLVESEDFSTVDMSKQMLGFWEKLLLAEAQRMISKMADNTKHGMLSYLLAAAVPLYNQALSFTQEPRMQAEVPKQSGQWGTYCKANSMMCSAKTDYHQAVVHRQKKEWGAELARLRVCLTKLNSLKEFCSSAEQSTLMEINRELEVIVPFVHDRKAQAEKDNYNIYQDEIPDKLADITQKLLVKSNQGLPQAMQSPKVPLFLKH